MVMRYLEGRVQCSPVAAVVTVEHALVPKGEQGIERTKLDNNSYGLGPGNNLALQGLQWRRQDQV